MSIDIDVYRKKNKGTYSELCIYLDNANKFGFENIGTYETSDAMSNIIIEHITPVLAPHTLYKVGNFYLSVFVDVNDLALHCSINIINTSSEKEEIFYEYRIYTRNESEIDNVTAKINQDLKKMGGYNHDDN